MSPLQKIRRNFIKVMFGTSMMSALNLCTLAINTNALGARLFGLLIVIQSVTELFNGVFAFNTWQALNKFGAYDIEAKNYKRLYRRYAFALLLDLSAAIVTAVTAFVAFGFFSHSFGFGKNEAIFGMIYAVGALFQVRSASIGILRLTDKFGLALSIQVIEAFILLLSATTLAALNASFIWYVITIAFFKSFGGIALFFMATHEIRVLKKGAPETSGESSFDMKAFLRFAFGVSASGTLGTFRNRGEVLIVSALLGPAAAGLFGVAFRGAAIISRFADAGRQSVYPVLSTLVTQNKLAEARDVILRVTAPVVLIGLAIIAVATIFGHRALALVFGQEFIAAYPSLIWLMIASLSSSCLFAAGPFVQIYFGAGRYFVLSCVSFAAFALGAVAGPLTFGIAGAGVGAATFGIVLAMLVSFHISAADKQKTSSGKPRTM